MHSLADLRRDYILQSLDENNVSPDAILQFTSWWNEVIDSRITEANAMVLATADEQGIPSARIVLLKGFSEAGFVFFTNYQSKKGRDLAVNPVASLVFFWKELERQVRITGIVVKLNDEANDAYFNSRPVASRLGATVSAQSTVIKNRKEIEDKMFEAEQLFLEQPVPRPEYWGGYLVKPEQIEFWQGRPSRLHDRIRYTKTEGDWKIERLSP